MEIGSSEWTALIRKGAEKFGVHLNSRQTEQFAVHGRDLLAWNRRINLTRITDPKTVAIRHFIDSLAPAEWISADARILDIGSGGGFPGIPLKVACPSLSVTLIDGVRKKINFLKTVIRNLNLKGIEARHCRAEEMIKADDSHARAYGVILCRALTALDRFVELARPLLSEGGTLIAMKGDLSSKEREDLARYLDNIGPFFRWEEKPYTLPVEGSRRTLVRLVHQQTEEDPAQPVRPG
ncbi:MAG: 16S rRNA (guanine(527)-N(7))-methyltransferase RsmG [Thermodesulfobacteriota bacterium]